MKMIINDVEVEAEIMDAPRPSDHTNHTNHTDDTREYARLIFNELYARMVSHKSRADLYGSRVKSSRRPRRELCDKAFFHAGITAGLAFAAGMVKALADGDEQTLKAVFTNPLEPFGYKG